MKYLFAVLFSLFCFVCVAQPPVVKEKAQNVYFLRKDRVSEVSSKDSADIILVVTEPDKDEKLYDVQEFGKEGNLIMLGKSVNVFPLKLDGQVVNFYPDRTRKSIEIYVSGRREGDAYQYYPNGKLHLIMSYMSKDSLIKPNFHVSYPDSLYKFEYDTTGKAVISEGKGHHNLTLQNGGNVAEEGDVKNGRPQGTWIGRDVKYHMSFREIYENGRLLDAESTDSLGNKYAYTKRVKFADVVKDRNGIFRGFVDARMRYPLYAREHNIQGRVIIGFKISPDGRASDFKVLKSLNPDTDAEALRVVQATKLWVPSEVYGKKIASTYSMPVSFALQ